MIKNFICDNCDHYLVCEKLKPLMQNVYRLYPAIQQQDHPNEQGVNQTVGLKILPGHPKFGFVKLVKTERSETAAMADLLD